jgi:hypothetical protein
MTVRKKNQPNFFFKYKPFSVFFFNWQFYPPSWIYTIENNFICIQSKPVHSSDFVIWATSETNYVG